MKYIDSEKLIAEIERRKDQTGRRLDNIVPIRRKDTMDEEQLAKIELRDKVDKAYLNGVLITLSDILSFITSLQQEQPMPDSIKLIELWHEDEEMLKEKDFRDDAWRLAYNAFMCGFGRGLAVKRPEQPLTTEKVVEQCKKFGGNPEVIQQEQKCIFGNTPSEDICSVCSAYCSLRVPKTKVSTSTEIATPSGQVDELTFEEYLRGVFEINNGIENDPDNLVRIHAPELLKLARKQEQPEVDLEKEVKSYIKHNFTITDEVAQIPEEDRRYSMWEDDMGAFAKHFFEFGKHTKYQQDRAEFAKLKAKEWQSGYHAGYAKGLNARKEK